MEPHEPRIVSAGEAELPVIAALAGDIWRSYYPGIITSDQIEHMLAWMYAPETLRRELRDEGARFYLLRDGDGEAVGFAALGPGAGAGEFKLHKLYLRTAFHGRGWGSRLLRHCEGEARRAGGARMTVAVNKRNTRALAAYRRNGYAIVEAVTRAIGGGFVMDDFILAKLLRE